MSRPILIRVATKGEANKRGHVQAALRDVPDRIGYFKGYMPYGPQGAGYYYVQEEAMRNPVLLKSCPRCKIGDIVIDSQTGEVYCLQCGHRVKHANPLRWGTSAFHAMRRAVAERVWAARKRAGGKGICAWDGKPVYADGVVREGKLFHKTHYELWKRGIKPEQLENPANNPGPRARPPAEWFAKMKVRVRANYPKRSSRDIDKIVAGIWWRYTDAQRVRIGKRYEVAANPMAIGYHNWAADNPITAHPSWLFDWSKGTWGWRNPANPKRRSHIDKKCPACKGKIRFLRSVIGGTCRHCGARVRLV